MHSTSFVHQSTGHQCGFNLQFGMHMEVALTNNLHVKQKNHIVHADRNCKNRSDSTTTSPSLVPLIALQVL